MIGDGLIRVISGTGAAPTTLGAFDRALKECGVHDLNLIPLSSVVPPNTAVIRDVPVLGAANIGDRLYCVLAEQRTGVEGQSAWAGIGWAVDKHGRGGVFVEGHGHSRAEVQSDLDATLESMIDDRNYLDFEESETELVGAECSGVPVCALVVAAYETAPWTR